MRKTLGTLLAAAALMLAACGDDDDNGGGDSANTGGTATEQTTQQTETETTEQTETTEAGQPYPQDVRETFMNGCERSSNGKTAVCRCSLEKIEEEYSLEEFREIDEKQREEGGPLPPEIQQIVEECVREES